MTSMPAFAVSIADPTAVSLDLSAPVEDLEQTLLTRRNVLLASSAPSQPPTPFGHPTYCNTPLDLCWVGIARILTRLFWHIPQNWQEA